MIATSNNSYQYECCNKTNNNNNIRTTNQQLCKWFHVNISERKCNELLLKFIYSISLLRLALRKTSVHKLKIIILHVLS